MNEELISVVMTVYNEPLNIVKQSLASILTQTYTNIEIVVVVDDPNNRNVINYLQSKKIKLIINDINLGLPKSLNIGIKQAKGNIIARMDCDDISYKDRLEKQYNFLRSNNYDLVTTGVEFIDEYNNILNRKYNIPKNEKQMEIRLRFENCLIHPTFMFYRYVFDQNYGYKEELIAAQDYEFILNTINNSFNIGVQNEILLKYRIRSNSISNKNFIKQIFIKKYIKEVYFRKKSYNKKYITKSLKKETLDFIKFEDEFIRYSKIEKGNVFLKYIYKLFYNIKYKNIRQNTINILIVKILMIIWR